MTLSEQSCPLCARPLGTRRELHHLVPRSYGGRETVTLHAICHRKIHTLLDERELMARYETVPRLRRHPEIRKFVRWLKGKPPDFYKPTWQSRRRKAKP